MTTTGQDGSRPPASAVVQLAISAYRNLGQAQREVERRKAELYRRGGRMTQAGVQSLRDGDHGDGCEGGSMNESDQWQYARCQECSKVIPYPQTICPQCLHDLTAVQQQRDKQ